ncbi:MAG: flavin reductase family protein [Candidatus Bipolaricaulia bacterium]
MGEVEARRFPKGVFIITSQWNGRRAGMTASWVTRVSAEPAMMAAALHRGSATEEIIQQSGWFVVHVLPESSVGLAREFGRGSSRDRDKFEGLDVSESRHGQPVLGAAVACLECRVVERHAVGDHHVVIGEIVDETETHAGEPLRYREDQFEV